MYSRNYSLHNSDMTEKKVECSIFFSLQWVTHLLWFVVWLWYRSVTLWNLDCDSWYNTLTYSSTQDFLPYLKTVNIILIQWIDQQPSGKYVNKLTSGNLLDVSFWANQIAIVIIIMIIHLVKSCNLIGWEPITNTWFNDYFGESCTLQIDFRWDVSNSTHAKKRSISIKCRVISYFVAICITQNTDGLVPTCN